MKDLPINKLLGVGKVHSMVLTGLGIKTCKDMITRASDVYVSYTEHQFKFFIR